MTITNPLHLYRSLLREATYLPLPACRSYVKDFIKQSFYRYHPINRKSDHRSPTATGHRQHPDSDQIPIENGHPSPSSTLSHAHQAHKGNRRLTLQRQTALLHRGRKFHSLLARANGGALKPIEKILRMTYGRIGRRRYDLLDSFNSPIRSLKGGIPPEERAPEPRDAKLSPHWKPPVQMAVLIVSQIGQQSVIPRAAGTTHKVKPAFVASPDADIWGKPLPQRRIKNQLHSWHLNNTRGVLPPLPELEYNELLRLVADESEIPPIPARRPRARARASTATAAELEEERAIAQTSSLILMGPLKKERQNPNGRTRLTPRFLQRRLVRSVLQQTPQAHVAENAKRGIVFSWSNGGPHPVRTTDVPVSKDEKQEGLLFG